MVPVKEKSVWAETKNEGKRQTKKIVAFLIAVKTGKLERKGLKVKYKNEISPAHLTSIVT
jgi:hypothetical protein